ncbi:MAG: putative beta-lysine N-acetyltransferase [Syntrophomonadaceae bacterium]|nr:putative beta-lysine N-acetyltransferase [Syntrophomonadaceae bacterium]
MNSVRHNNQSSNYYMTIDDTVILWDWFNQRVKIWGNQKISKNTLQFIKTLANNAAIGKIVACTLPAYQEMFLEQGFVVEGKISGFFSGKDAQVYSHFTSPARGTSDNKYDVIVPVGSNWDRVKETIEQTSFPCITRKATPADVPGMISLFRDVFKTYPSPVFDSDYLLGCMEYGRVTYRVAIDANNQIVGIASAEQDPANLNAEITDCVTDPQFRGQGVLSRIIGELEADLYREGYICLYTLCRATHAPVNKAFFRLGYVFTGRLIKNCNICGSYEDMNVLVKVLR